MDLLRGVRAVVARMSIDRRVAFDCRLRLLASKIFGAKAGGVAISFFD